MGFHLGGSGGNFGRVHPGESFSQCSRVSGGFRLPTFLRHSLLLFIDPIIVKTAGKSRPNPNFTKIFADRTIKFIGIRTKILTGLSYNHGWIKIP